MSLRVSITPTGKRSVGTLRGRVRKSFDAAVKRLAADGCRAGDYRLSGTGVERICVLRLYGHYRTLVAFPDEESVVVLLVGEHLDDDPELDLYRGLYRLLELPEPTARRTKPPCCDEDGRAPVDPDLLDRFWRGARELNRRSRHSAQQS